MKNLVVGVNIRDLRLIAVGLCALIVSLQTLMAGIPEPGLLLFGKVNNRNSNGDLITAGTIEWRISIDDSGESVRRTVDLENLNDQFSYVLQVPFETRMVEGQSLGRTPNTLELPLTDTSVNIAPQSFDQQPAFLVDPEPSAATITFPAGARGHVQRIDFVISGEAEPTNPGGLPNPQPVEAPVIKIGARFVDGIFQFEFDGGAGQTYTLEASEDLENWVPVSQVVGTVGGNIEVSDPESVVVPQRFYRIVIETQ